MWTPLLLCLLVVSAAQADNSPWKANTQYKYALRGRTLTALHQVAGQYTGLFMKAAVNVQQKSENVVSVQIESPQYAELHANLSQGWASPIPEGQLHYQQMPLSNKPFELKYKNGAISSMVVSKNIPTWELNILKSVASQFQVDTQAENLQKSRINSLPNKEFANGVYKTMEDFVDGECETLYDVSPLPQVVLQNKPELAPMRHLQADGQIIDIVKTRNFSNCDVPSTYHFGITGLTDWEPGSNQMGKFLARSSVSRVVISGNLQRYTIQSSVTTSKVIASPFLYDRQNAMVVSRVNLTLVDVKSGSGSPQSPPNPETINNLVYEYDPASPQENNQGRDQQQQHGQYGQYQNYGSGSSSSSSSSSSSDSSSSSSSSSNESQEQNNYNQNNQTSFQNNNRYRRSLRDSENGGSYNNGQGDDSWNNRGNQMQNSYQQPGQQNQQERGGSNYNNGQGDDNWNNNGNQMQNNYQQPGEQYQQERSGSNYNNGKGVDSWNKGNQMQNNYQQPGQHFHQGRNGSSSSFGYNQEMRNWNNQTNGGNRNNGDFSSSSDSSSSSSESGQYGHYKTFQNQNGQSQDSLSSSSSSSSSDSDSSSSSSFSWDSSEEENWQQRPSLDQPPRVPFMPMFVANQGNSVQSAKDIQIVSVVKRIAEQIGNDLQSPSAIPGQKTLSKFSIMAGLLRTMNAKQMEEAAKDLYYPLSRASISSPADARKYQAWAAYRDAIAQAGTGPALLTIKEWIQSKKIQGEEAAQIVSVLPNTAHFPNIEYMNTFFALATSSEVQHQRFLNTSVVLSFANLARKAFVSNSTAHNRFPIHTFGALKPKREQPVVQQYIPFFARALKEAASREDSIKIRTYILALGNFAHPRILNVFEPYLEGKEPMTHFQRLTIVAALSQLAKTYPKVARPVLFRIYQNTGEATELRVAAVFQLMKTNPPAQLLQRMAQFTNDDEDTQVISAVQSAIRSAAFNTQEPDQHDLQMNAQAAVNLLSPEKHPADHSKQYLRSYYARQLNLAYKQSFSYIGSDSGFFPDNLYYTLRQNLGGFKKQAFGFSAMSSSLDALVDLFEDQFADFGSSSSSSSSGHKNQQSQKGQQHGSGSGSGSSFSYDQINNMLNIQPSEQEQVEAGLVFATPFGKRFFAFDNHTIEQLPQYMKNAAASLRSGQSFNYTKIANKETVNIAFPTAMGLPFYFSLQTPTLVYIGGQAQVKSHPDLASGNNNEIQPPQTINASVDVQFVLSSLLQSRMGFVAPFNHEQYIAGVNRNIQVNIPIRAEIDVDAVNWKVAAKVQPLDQHNKQNVFEYSTEPYTNKQNVFQMVQNPNQAIHEGSNNNKRIVHVRQPNQFHTTVGQDSSGFAFDFDYHSEQKFVDFASLYNEARKHDPISAVVYAWAEESINFNNITVAYNPQKSSAKYARFTAAYLDDENDSGSYGSKSGRGSGGGNNYDYESGSYGSKGGNYHTSDRGGSQQGSGDNQHASPIDHVSANMARPSSSSPDSQSRQQEFLQKAGQGIQDSNAMVVDFSAEFQGQNKAHYVATFAYATSYVSPKSRFLFFAEQSPANSGNNKQYYAVGESSMPNVPLMNFEKALNADPTSYFGFEMAYGDKSQQASRVQVKGKMQQSQAFRHYLEQSPLAHLCKQQMQEGNTVQYACRNVTARANILDQYQFSMNFEKIPVFWKNATYKAYSIIRHTAFQYLNEDFLSHNNPTNKIDMEASFAPDLKSVNISFDAPVFSAEFINVRLNPSVSAFLTEHPEYNAVQRLYQEVFRGDQFPTCVMDSNQAETFDNTTYPIKLGKCWHAMFHYTPKDDPTSDSSDDDDDDDEITVLVRDASSSNEKEVMVVIGDNAIHMTPTSGNSPANVKVNGQQASASKNSISEYDDQSGETFVQFYALPTGAIRMYAPQQDVEVQYDGTAIKLKAQNSYRSEVRGLCGTFNTQPEDDFTTPQDCVLQNPYEFAATYALVDSSCQGPAKDYKQRAQQKVSSGQCYRDNVIYGNVVADQQQQAPPNSKSSGSKNYQQKGKGYEKYSTSCSEQRTQMLEVDGKMCFSKTPYMQCASHCRPQGFVKKQVQVVCLNPSSTTEHFQNNIKRGVNPDFRQKTATQTLSMNIAESCVTV